MKFPGVLHNKHNILIKDFSVCVFRYFRIVVDTLWHIILG